MPPTHPLLALLLLNFFHSTICHPPYLASLVIPTQPTPTHHCHAVQISPTHFLTSPHCHDPSLNLTLLLPSHPPLSILSFSLPTPANPHALHPSLLTISTPLPTPALLLPSTPTFPPPAARVSLVSFSPPEPTPQPLQFQANVLDPSQCPTAPHHPPICTSPTHLCIPHPDPIPTSPCPLCDLTDDHSVIAKTDDGDDVLIAIGSRDAGRCAQSLLSSYFRIAPYIDWLVEQGVPFRTGTPKAVVGVVEIEEVVEVTPSPEAEDESEGEVVAGGLQDEVEGEADDGGAGSLVGVLVGVPLGLLVLAVGAWGAWRLTRR